MHCKLYSKCLTTAVLFWRVNIRLRFQAHGKKNRDRAHTSSSETLAPQLDEGTGLIKRSGWRRHRVEVQHLYHQARRMFFGLC